MNRKRYGGTVATGGVRHLSVAVLSLTLLAVAACGGGGGDASGSPSTPSNDSSPPALVTSPDPALPLPRSDVRGIDTIRPYRPDGPHAHVLRDCALIEDAVDGCPLGTLPFLARSSLSGDATGGTTISVDDVMSRVLVTHDWMGERFETLLSRSSPTLVSLFGATTLIVIGSTVRPSNYWVGTGGIQIDPAYLWLTRQEKQTISVRADHRSAYARTLDFRFLAADRIDGQRASRWFDLEDHNERTLADIVVPLTSLLHHELAHANDFLPPGSVVRLDTRLPPWRALRGIADEWLSPQLYRTYPPGSALLTRLASVRYRGEVASVADRRVSPAVASAEMAGDGTTHFYSYSTQREDFANLFELAMNKLTLDLDTHVGFTNQPADFDNFQCGDLALAWGVYNRLGDPLVTTRSRWAVERIIGPSETLDTFFAAQLGTDRPMSAGLDWCTSLDRDDGARSDDATARAKQAERKLLLAPPSASERHDALGDSRRNPLLHGPLPRDVGE